MSNVNKKKLPVGIESFEKIRTQDFYYVDKTVMIRDLIQRWGEVNLFTRPRRFGKSLNMSMLKAFFEIGGNRALFDGLKISEEKEICEEYMGKFPVISISLKDVEGSDYDVARTLLCSVIGNEALRFYELLKSSPKLNEVERRQYEQLVCTDHEQRGSFAMSDSVLMGSLKTLSSLLEKHYEKKVILLIDEYDVPLSKANEQGYYNEMVFLMRNLLQQVLKTNSSLYFAVLTGCLRVAKESIFTGLNNFKIYSITDVRFDEYFGFTDSEVKEMLAYYGQEAKVQTVREWYDGYHFGTLDVYCPWDVISYCDDLIDDKDAAPKNYWINTSGNDVVRHFIEKMGNGVMKGEMEALIDGKEVEKEIHEDLTYHEIYDSVNHLWSMLFMTGYLTRQEPADGDRYKLVIPNLEIRSIFIRQIMAMFKKEVAKDGKLLESFCNALEQGNAAEVEKLFSSYLKKSISIRDTFVQKTLKENFYHGILLRILGYKDGWILKSNKESGNGYGDIWIYDEEKELGIIIEVKYAEESQFEVVCREAIAQIDKNRYAEELREEGCHSILKYGIACYKKRCQVTVVKEKVE
ncbi:AAA family ATPase [Drancourtella massiliensis]|nr:AAA family ATPase [Drancourtella massiliensis]MBM6744331.1 AAA family ATPase [Drancourtella massiliensis]